MKIILLNTLMSQLFTKIIKQKVYTIVIKMPSWMAWVHRTSGLIKMREEAQVL